MKILALNAGSSTLKASLFDVAAPGNAGDAPSGLCWENDSGDGEASLEALLAPLWTGADALLSGPEAIGAIGHRVVHGGSTLSESTRVTGAVRAEIERVAEYAPLHNASALALMEETTHLFGEHVPQVAVFDTAFHQTMPPAAYTYPGPYAWVAQGIRRYGFHGISHQYVSHRAAKLLDRPKEALRVVTCHLGSGCSLTAVQGGASVDTTMGFTPLDGLPMARRSGALDPGILIHLLRNGGHTVDSLDHLLHHEAGLAGLSGTSGDFRVVQAAADRGHERAQLALEVFVHRVRQGIAAMATTMEGLDVLGFTGGIGQNAARIRAEICGPLSFMGIRVDRRRNATCGEADISGGSSRVRVLVIPAQENWMIAQESLRLLSTHAVTPARATGGTGFQ